MYDFTNFINFYPVFGYKKYLCNSNESKHICETRLCIVGVASHLIDYIFARVLLVVQLKANNSRKICRCCCCPAEC